MFFKKNNQINIEIDIIFNKCKLCDIFKRNLNDSVHYDMIARKNDVLNLLISILILRITNVLKKKSFLIYLIYCFYNVIY